MIAAYHNAGTAYTCTRFNVQIGRSLFKSGLAGNHAFPIEQKGCFSSLLIWDGGRVNS
jgi:hypothetical protein